MRTEQQKAVFPQTVAVALAQLKDRLQEAYERSYPELREIIRLVLEEEAATARELSMFPHLLLPDLVDARIARLNLQRPMAEAQTSDARHLPQGQMPQLAFA